MIKMAKEKRWFDDEDFTPEHDKLMIEIMTNGPKYLHEYVPEYITAESLKVQWSIKGEPCLEGYPPIYPDAIVCLLLHNKYYDKLVIEHTYVIEIKPRIDSFGSVLRQVQLYRSRMMDKRNRHWVSSEQMTMVLFTPDTRYDSLFKQQNIEVIHPKESD